MFAERNGITPCSELITTLTNFSRNYTHKTRQDKHA